MTYGLPDSMIFGTYKRFHHRHRSGGARGSFAFPRYDYYFSKLTLFPTEMDKLLNQETTGVGFHLNRIATRIKALAIAQVGKESGGLAKSIRWEYERVALGQARRIYADHKLAMIHHEGTRPHLIDPPSEKLLKFVPRGGHVVFSHQVMHPGTPANRFLSDQLPYVATYLGSLRPR